MTTAKILNVDFRKKEGREIVQKVLRKIGPLAKCSVDKDIPLRQIEKALLTMVRKYEITPQWLMFSMNDDAPRCTYSLSIKTSDTHQWVGTVYAACVYEAFAKATILIYATIKKGGVAKRKPKDYELERRLRAEAVNESDEV